MRLKSISTITLSLNRILQPLFDLN